MIAGDASPAPAPSPRAPSAAAGAARPATVALQGIGKTYDAAERPFVALRPLDLEFRAGELTLLVGPSGSGKSTLLSIVGCLLRPSTGRLLIGGVDACALSESERARLRRRRLGFVFQGYNLFPNLTAAENVEVGLDLKAVRRAGQRAASLALLQRVGIAEFAGRFPAKLSGGQCQRVAIARALAGGPDLVLADEPTAALDWASGRGIFELLQGLARREGRTVLIVTHDHRALPFADRIIRLEDGEVKDDLMTAGRFPAATAPAAAATA